MEQLAKQILHLCYQLARLSPVDMKVISNMQLIAGSPENKAKSGSFSLKFDAGKVTDSV
jgi:hypothetical protein